MVNRVLRVCWCCLASGRHAGKNNRNTAKSLICLALLQPAFPILTDILYCFSQLPALLLSTCCWPNTGSYVKSYKVTMKLLSISALGLLSLQTLTAWAEGDVRSMRTLRNPLTVQ
jgi:hypothetical protein